MLPSLASNTVMENPQDLFGKLGGGGGGVADHDNTESFLGGSGNLNGIEDDPFNDSGNDFFEKFMAEEAAKKNQSNSNNNNNDSAMNLMDSGLNAQSLLEEALQKSTGSLSLDGGGKMGDGDEMTDAPGATSTRNTLNSKISQDVTMGIVSGWPGAAGASTGSTTSKKIGVGGTQNWFQPAGVGGSTGAGKANNNDNNRPLNATLDAMPLNVSLGLSSGAGSATANAAAAAIGSGSIGGGGSGGSSSIAARKNSSSSSITATLRRKGSNASMTMPKPNSVIKANISSSKLRSNKSDGLLARALKARYNSSPNINKYNVNAETMASITAQIPGRTLSAGGDGPIVQMRSGLFAGGNSINSLNAVEEEGNIRAGFKNASWGAPPSSRSTGGSASLFSKMLNSPTGSKKTKSRLATSVSASSLLRKKGSKSSSRSSSRSSMQDLLRLCKKQSKTQSLLRQSSAHSLLKQTSSQSLKDLSRKVDVSSLLPPQHAASPHTNNRKWLNNAGFGKAGSSQGKPPDESAAKQQPQNNIETSSLLHQSCRLYPTTAAVVESALRIDPDAVRRAVPVPLEKGQMKKPQNVYGYPVNVALTHGGSMEVIKMLIDAGPDVLVQKDGTDGSGSLGIALMSKRDMAVLNMLVQANPDCVKVSDRRGNYPLHVAVNYGLPIAIVKRLCAMYPKALQMRNFHSQTPLDIAQRSTRCPEEVMNFLQSTAFSPLESNAHHIDHPIHDDLEDGLDDIMQTNF